jgi:hypothetical protein
MCSSRPSSRFSKRPSSRRPLILAARFYQSGSQIFLDHFWNIQRVFCHAFGTPHLLCYNSIKLGSILNILRQQEEVQWVNHEHTLDEQKGLDPL